MARKIGMHSTRPFVMAELRRGGSARKSLKELTQDVDSILYDIEYLCQNFNASGIDDVSERVNKAVVAFKEYKETCIDVSHPRKRCRGVTCSTSESD